MIYLLRHGRIDTGLEKRYIGWTNLPLNKNGIHQANQWREKLSSINFDTIYCSDLDRAYQTAEIIGKKKSIRVKKRPALREINMGELENLPMTIFQKQFPEKWQERGENLLSYRPEDGESFADLQHRVVPEFEKIALKTIGNSLVISHAGVNRIILCHITGMPPENMFRIDQAYACLNIIDQRQKPYRIAAMGIRLQTEG